MIYLLLMIFGDKDFLNQEMALKKVNAAADKVELFEGRGGGEC